MTNNNAISSDNQKNRAFSLTFMIMAVMFTVCLILSNLLATKIFAINLPFLSACLGHDVKPIIFTGGMFIFPFSYILNDCFTEVYGYRKTKFVIWLAFLMNFFVVISAQIVAWIPGASFWDKQDAFNSIFSLAPRIALASFLAFLVGSFLNSYIMSKMKLKSYNTGFSVRAVLSTLVGEGADSMVFFPIAFAGLIPISDLLVMIFIQVFGKTMVEVLFLPLTIRLVNKVKQIDNSDIIDDNISYNPFKFRDI